jgi:ATP-dependent Clp protease ATP-binding subunit ClpC
MGSNLPTGEDNLASFPRTPETERVLIEAGEWAQRYRSLLLEPRHLLLALLAAISPDGESREATLAARTLMMLGVKPERIAGGIAEELPLASEPSEDAPAISVECEWAFSRAIDLAAADGRDSREVDSPHLLMALLEIEPPPHTALRRMRELDITADVVLATWRQLPDQVVRPVAHNATSGLTSDLTAKAAAGELDPVIGREEEIERMITVLCRRTKNNVCLVGLAGVGKTAMAEGLAQRIASGKVPPRLKGARILTLEVSRLVAGTVFRGSFEDKVNKFLDELKAAPGTILFIDELHTIVGAGGTGAEGTNDFGNFLKPFLARGEVSVIGATTRDEYRRFIERDSALERRFQAVEIEEPDTVATRAILEGLAPIYAKHHSVSYSSDILDACVSLAARHLPARHFPDKAIDLLDEAGAEAAKTGVSSVRLEDIAAALPRVKTGRAHEAARRRGVAAHLAATLIGQQAAITSIAETIETGQLGLAEHPGPLNSMLFFGPSASGKGLAAKVIAEVFYDGAMTVIDLAEYGEPHTIAGLIGAPPGYVGYEQQGRLVEPLRHRPGQVVLLKHVDAADRGVRALLADLLATGSLRDTHDREASFREAIVIFTVTDEAKAGGSLGFRAETASSAPVEISSFERDALRKSVGPGIVNSVDEIVRFWPLDAAALRSAATQRVSALIANFAGRGVAVSIAPELFEQLLVAVGHAGGLRDLDRLVRRFIERPVALTLSASSEASAVHVEWSGARALASAVGEPVKIAVSQPRLD